MTTASLLARSFLLRVAEPAGSYDSGYASQVAPRDAAIDASPAACP